MSWQKQIIYICMGLFDKFSKSRKEKLEKELNEWIKILNEDLAFASLIDVTVNIYSLVDLDDLGEREIYSEKLLHNDDFFNPNDIVELFDEGLFGAFSHLSNWKELLCLFTPYISLKNKKVVYVILYGIANIKPVSASNMGYLNPKDRNWSEESWNWSEESYFDLLADSLNINENEKWYLEGWYELNQNIIFKLSIKQLNNELKNINNKNLMSELLNNSMVNLADVINKMSNIKESREFTEDD